MSSLDAIALAKKFGQPVSFQNNSALFHDGDACQGLLLVTKGSIKVIKISDDGKEALLYRVNENNLCIISVSCLIGSKHYNAEGIAEENVEGVYLSAAEFHRLIHSDENFRNFIFSNFADRISDFILRLDEVIFKSLKERLKKYIQDETNKSQNADLHKTHQDIAIELGSSREVISRLLKTLESEGFIAMSRQSIKKI